ncbi:MAG: recombinase family protein [Oscillospiraceae bacterium]|nr:recombinase family protein [Oscillospiraceae bacterium]
MARTSRVRRKEAPAILRERIYKVALYVRLSVLDSGKKDSDTVETQETLLQRFIQGKPHFKLVSVYIDNGETGVNFKRSEFERLMEDVKAGKIDCIIVKDLSRFGRNYIETGEYLEKIFPFLGIRFIAVNDGYDSISPSAADSLSLHLKNLVNDVYARDISAKICPVLREKQERGEFIGAWAAYGYVKSRQDKHRILVDRESASVVRDIFRWRLEGLSYQSICRRLTKLGVSSPSQYRYVKGLVQHEKWKEAPWRIQTIKDILGNQVYLGHMVQGRKRESLFHGQSQMQVPKEQWIIVENTHEPVIDRQTFDAVQRLNRQKTEEYWTRQERFSELENTENLLKGLVYCGDCGTNLVRYKNVRENKHTDPKFHVWYNYICPVHTTDLTQCSFLSIPERTLLEAVNAAIKVQMITAMDMEKKLRAFAEKSPVQEEKDRYEVQIRQAEENLTRTIRYRERLYDDYADRLMNEQDYVYAQKRYKEQEVSYQRQLEELKLAYQKAQDTRDEEHPLLNRLLRFQSGTELTREMAVELIDKIIVYGRESFDILFRFQDEYELLKSCLDAEKEAAHG